MENEVKVGQRFGKLVVITPVQTSRSKVPYCFVDCDCGKRGKQVRVDLLVSGKSNHCGCETVKKASTSKVLKEPLHRVWSDMIQRCKNPKRPYYYLYGGRGIKVCKEWRNNYLAFYDWAIKNGYKLEMLDFHRNRYTLDRIDINGDYTPENCRWVDYREQNENKRHNLILEIDGEKKKIIEWLHQFNAKTPYFYSLLRDGMTELQAIEYIRNS